MKKFLANCRNWSLEGSRYVELLFAGGLRGPQQHGRSVTCYLTCPRVQKPRRRELQWHFVILPSDDTMIDMVFRAKRAWVSPHCPLRKLVNRFYGKFAMELRL